MGRKLSKQGFKRVLGGFISVLNRFPQIKDSSLHEMDYKLNRYFIISSAFSQNDSLKRDVFLKLSEVCPASHLYIIYIYIGYIESKNLSSK